MSHLHNRRDALRNDLDALRRQRDGIEAMAAQIDSCDDRGEHWDVTEALFGLAGTVTERLLWVRMDADVVGVRLPGERAWEPMVL